MSTFFRSWKCKVGRNLKIDIVHINLFPIFTGKEIRSNKIKKLGTSLAVQWLRLKLLMQKAKVQSLAGEIRPHMLWVGCGQNFFRN